MHRLLASLGVVELIFMYSFRATYLGELLSSFLPYLVAVWIVCTLASLGCLFIFNQRKTQIISGFSLILFVILSVIGGREILDFYTVGGKDSHAGAETVRVLYGNIYIYNEHYLVLENLISLVDPDVLVLVEFARHHWSALEGFLDKQGLQYTNRINRDGIYDSNLFASHTPIDQVISYQGLENYINIESQQMRLGEHDVMFHVVHLISPISEDHFRARNNQLDDLVKMMHKATQDHPGYVHILLGDFNTSPWSVYYQKFVDGLGPQRVNHTRQIPLFMTWRLPPASRLRSHIDHVWVWGEASLEVKPYRVDGSDHRMMDISIY